MSGVYVHIPFCLHKCDYCDFLSFEGSGRSVQEAYVAALLQEIKAAKNEFTSPISTIYFGGGTPTALPSPLLCKILAELGSLPLSRGVEVTVEANPGTIDVSYLRALRQHGATRLSLGLQSTHAHLLENINRRQNTPAFFTSYRDAQVAGFININVDLMFGLPGQTMAQWAQSVGEVVALAPSHISAYSLTLAPGTPLWQQEEDGVLVLPNDELDRRMYHYMVQVLGDAGYNHYELSNFAKPGMQSRHNVDCWTRAPYRGFGLGAHSFCERTRWHNTESLDDYIAGDTGRYGVELLTDDDADVEYMMLGLRLIRGVPLDGVPAAHIEKVQSLMRRGLLTQRGAFVCLTPQGLDLANQVFGSFI